MDKTLFDDLVQSLKEATDISKGKAEPLRRFDVPGDIDTSDDEVARLFLVKPGQPEI
jgi:hypothetical protein